ncbi:serine-rich adhesin for platelets-like isoform X2 [Oscarella lobularis]|uniref:serine-rich adhesin for platelets-like isoform X2 n=1 Tax=Oscarella lobularis TaxID=121494 RepID=UPI003313F6D9
MSSADQLTLASYSKTDSTVRFAKDGDSGSTGGCCRSSGSIAWMIGTAIVLAFVGVAVGCVALALVLTKDTTTCNCEEPARPSISPQRGSQAPKTDSGNIHYTDTPRVHMTESAPPGGHISSTSAPSSAPPGGHISSTSTPSSGSDLASRLVAVENSYASLRKDVQDLSKSVDGLKTLKTNVSTIQQLSNQLNVKVKTLETSTTNQTTTSTAFFLSCAQRYDRSTSSLSRGVQYYRDSSSESLCDSSEQGVVWTLIESFSKENDYSSFGSRNGFSFPFPNPPLNPVAYRNSFTSSARTDSTHFRATCNFFTSLSISSGNPSAANDNTAVVALVDYDPVLDGGRGCTRTEFMSIEGRTCRHCTAYWSQSLGEHLHYDPSSDNCTAPNIGGNAHYWGYYHTKPPANFACTQSPTSTTQYWLGRYTNRTCMGYLRRGGNPASGIYVVEDFDGKPYKVFCDFDSEVGASWTLIEAFERDQADGVDSSSPHRAFVVDRPLSEDSPNLKSYRLSRNRMLSLRSSSSK